MEETDHQHANWINLPEHIVLKVFGYLTRREQFRAALTCHDWMNIFASPYNWRHQVLRFYMPQDQRNIAFIHKYGRFLRSVIIKLDQYDAPNREQACTVIRDLANNSERRVEKLSLQCTGRNPLFYAGLEFVDALHYFFREHTEKCKTVHTLKSVDLSGLPFLFDDSLFVVLADHHPTLEYLNIQNSPLVCRVSPNCMLYLVQHCRRLKDFRLLNCSLSEEILQAFTQPNREPLQHLALTCRREEKYTKDLSSATWQMLREHLPHLKVTLRFDHTCPLHKIARILKPEIPCSVLRLETFTFIHDEIHRAAQYYANTLEKMVVQTRPSQELNDAILALSDSCPKLKALHVFCILDKETIECILEKHPDMKLKGTFTLRHEVGPDGIWVTEEELNL